MSRARARRHQAHLKHVVTCRQMKRLLHKVQTGQSTWQQLLDSDCARTIAADAELLTTAIMPPALAATTEPDIIMWYMLKVSECQQQHRASLRKLTKDHIAESLRKDRDHFTKLYYTSPKKATKRIFTDTTNTGCPQHVMPAMHHPTQGLVCDPTAITQSVHYYHRAMACPKIPLHLANQVPWKHETAPDRYILEQRGTPGTPLYANLTTAAFRK
jgi:hypothetical protein